MSYFPESLMPKKLKQESVDVDGNQFIVSASDFNRHDEEIRAIEKVIGVPKLPVPGGDTPSDNCSILSILVQIGEQLKKIRDDFVFTASGIVAVKDPDVVGIDRLIPFPTNWAVTELTADIGDDGINDEDEIEKLASIEIDDVAGMPDEGYVTIINDISIAPVPIVHTSNLIFYSPLRVNGKVNTDFIYEILVSLPTATLSIDATTPLPGGLVLGDRIISGIPTTEGIVTVKINAVAGSKTATLELIITIVAENTPTLAGSPYSTVATAGSVFIFTIPAVGAIKTITATGLPDGLTLWGATISGTPRQAAVATIDILVVDEFGNSVAGMLTLTIG